MGIRPEKVFKRSGVECLLGGWCLAASTIRSVARGNGGSYNSHAVVSARQSLLEDRESVWSRTPLFAAERNDDFLVAPQQDHLAILDRLDRDLIRLIAKSQSKLLALRHRLAVDDGEMCAGVERDGSDEKAAGWISGPYGCSGPLSWSRVSSRSARMDCGCCPRK